MACGGSLRGSLPPDHLQVLRAARSADPRSVPHVSLSSRPSATEGSRVDHSMVPDQPEQHHQAHDEADQRKLEHHRRDHSCRGHCGGQQHAIRCGCRPEADSVNGVIGAACQVRQSSYDDCHGNRAIQPHRRPPHEIPPPTPRPVAVMVAAGCNPTTSNVATVSRSLGLCRQLNAYEAALPGLRPSPIITFGPPWWSAYVASGSVRTPVRSSPSSNANTAAQASLDAVENHGADCGRQHQRGHGSELTAATNAGRCPAAAIHPDPSIAPREPDMAAIVAAILAQMALLPAPSPVDRSSASSGDPPAGDRGTRAGMPSCQRGLRSHRRPVDCADQQEHQTPSRRS